jgi:hypothetical protein
MENINSQSERALGLGNKDSHISDVILQLAPESPQQSQPNGIQSDPLDDLLVIDEDERKVAVRITATDVESLTPLLEELNFEVLNSAPDEHFIEGFVPFNSITELDSLAKDGLLGVLPIYQPITSVGDVTSQADGVHEADRVRNELGYDGTGLTIGIMSDSYDDLDGATNDIASDDLPDAGVNVLQDLNDNGSDEGRAMAQLVHDLAPGADLAFSSVFLGELDFAQQIRNLADPTKGNADVLVDDVTYFAEPFFQDGKISQAIDDVVNAGATYYSSAGNSADQSYESTDFAAAADSEGFYSGTFHDFNSGAGTDTRQSITVPAGERVILSLQWDDPFYTTNGVDTNLDIFLLQGSTNTVLAGAANNNITSQTPFEITGYTNSTGSPQNLDVVIRNTQGPSPQRIKYVNFGADITFNQFDTNSPTVIGHHSATNAQAVAASPYFDPTNAEPFTSIGPNTIIFEPDGTRKATPEVRQTPEITAVDGTNTTFFGQDIEGDGFPNFFGTSAAAPHAAAISALIQEANPNLTPQEVYDVLANTALDIGAPGFDNVTGAGLINAFDAVSSVLPDENTPPVANDDTATTNQNQAVTVDVLANDTDVDEDVLNLDSFDSTSTEGGTITRDDNGTSADTSDDQLTYTPAMGFTGTDTFEYTVSDGTATDMAMVTVTVDEVIGANNPPVAVDDTATTNQDQAVSVDVLLNDTDADNDVLNIASFDNASAVGGTVALDDNGTVADSSDDQLTYTPSMGFSGSDTFEYTVSDGIATDMAMVTVTVDEVMGEPNIINGTPARDNLTGTDGDDMITGGFGADMITGGVGSDTFVYNNLRDKGDIITDFTLEEDQIDLSNLFSNLGISSAQVGFTDTAEGTFITLDSDNSGIFRNYILLQGNEINEPALNNAENTIFVD